MSLCLSRPWRKLRQWLPLGAHWQEPHATPPLAVVPAVPTPPGWPVLSVRLVPPDQPAAEAIAPHEATLQVIQDETALRLLVQGRLVLAVPHTDRTGQRWLVQQLIQQDALATTTAAELLGLSPRTIQRDQAAYQEQQDSAWLVDRRRFNQGQQVAYRAVEHEGTLISRWVLNLLGDEPTHGRHLEMQLDGVLDDRTIDRTLGRLGLRAAEVTGLRQQVQEEVAAIRQAAYWAGVAQQPLAAVTPPLQLAGWAQQVSDQAALSLVTGQLVGNGAYETAQGLHATRDGLISAPRAWHHLLTYLASSGGARLSQAKHHVWTPLQALLGGRLVGTS
ncbi:MAG: hypothetical protein KKB13_05965, partial [Chloroflexi bacterium]|nr:hypothetical protein [Chloroflexota bacterium]